MFSDALGWLGAAALLAGVVWGALGMRRHAAARRSLPGAVCALVAASLWLQSAALLLHGVSAQVATGSYWSWTTRECWQLAAWLATALLGVGLRRLDWEGRGAFAGLLLVALFVLYVALGAPWVAA